MPTSSEGIAPNSEQAALQNYRQAAALAQQAVAAFDSASDTDNSARKLEFRLQERSLWQKALKKLEAVSPSSRLYARSLAKKAQYERLLTTAEGKIAKANDQGFILGIIQDANIDPQAVHVTLCQIESPHLESERLAANRAKTADPEGQSLTASQQTASQQTASEAEASNTATVNRQSQNFLQRSFQRQKPTATFQQKSVIAPAEPSPFPLEKGQLNRDYCRHHQGEKLMASPASLIKIPIAVALAHRTGSEDSNTGITASEMTATEVATKDVGVTDVGVTDVAGADTNHTNAVAANATNADDKDDADDKDIDATTDASDTGANLANTDAADATANSVNLDQKIYIDPGNFTENAAGAVIEIGQEYSLRKVMSRMIIDSDNIATNQLIDYLGYADIEQSLKQLGYSQTLVGHKLAGDQVMPQDFGISSNQSSTHEITAMMAQIYAIDTPANRDIMAALSHQADRELGYEALTADSTDDSTANSTAGLKIEWLGEKTGQNAEVLASTLAMSIGEDDYVLTVALDNDSDLYGLRQIIRGIADHLSKVGPLIS